MLIVARVNKLKLVKIGQEEKPNLIILVKHYVLPI